MGRCLKVKNATIKLQSCLGPLPGEAEVPLGLAAFIYFPEVDFLARPVVSREEGSKVP